MIREKVLRPLPGLGTDPGHPDADSLDTTHTQPVWPAPSAHAGSCT